MYVKDGSYAVSMENRCKMGINFLIWVGQVSILEKCLNDSVTFEWHILKKMETWPIHIKKSMFNGQFTPIFH
jgi:hypothetical protein